MQRTDGMTALMWAAQNRHVDCVRLLVDKEAGMKEKTGWTALMFAMKIGSIDCVKLLVREKSLRDSTGGDALCMAKLWGCHEIVSSSRTKYYKGWSAAVKRLLDHQETGKGPLASAILPL